MSKTTKYIQISEAKNPAIVRFIRESAKAEGRSCVSMLEQLILFAAAHYPTTQHYSSGDSDVKGNTGNFIPNAKARI